MRMASAAQSLSAELGLTGRIVFFNDWVPYAERAGYLLDADIGLSLHFDHIETRFSFRTRLLDYIWGGLPMVLTRGDALSALAEARGLARTVAPESVDEVAQAIQHWLDRPGERAAVAGRAQRLAAELSWSRAVAPLAAFCRAPARAPDSAAPEQPRVYAGLLAKAWSSLRARGLRGLWRDIRLYLNLPSAQ
jgi:glycosyltransferase involved in cell wall biosynthesis